MLVSGLGQRAGIAAVVALVLTGCALAAALIAAADARAQSSDLILLVSDFNEGAQRFYKRMGYEQIGAIPGYVLPDVAELIFRKALHE